MLDLKAKLTPHFRVAEFFNTHQSGGTAGLIKDFESLPFEKRGEILGNLKRLAEALERVRAELGGRQIVITSGWRSKRVNDLAGGANASFHLSGMAADITVKGLTPKEVQNMLEKTWPGGLGYGATFTHLDIRKSKARFKYS
jgi:uncharacterized protein YcbK (DUF882 family)